MKKGLLNVFADRKMVGSIARSDVDEDTFLFSYGKAIPTSLAVSLTMPPRVDAYDSMGGLLPIFEMNLPEGGLKDKLRNNFAKAIPNFDDLDMLAIVGSSQIGRLRFSYEESVPEILPEEDLARLLAYQGSEDLFAELLEKFARYSGISGVQPKVLMREIGGPEKLTQLGATHIVKAFNPSEYPELAANEEICCRGAIKAGLKTAAVTLSANRKLLVVDRFDRNNEGEYLGIEDFCVLSGRRAHGRYEGSYEDVARRITDFVSPENLAMAREQFVLMVAYACAIENGDAHLKNFSVIYENADTSVSLAPAYDIVSTTPYAPRDTLALKLNGTKQFPDRKTLLRFIRSVTGKSERAAAQVIERATEGGETAISAAKDFGKKNPDAKTFAGILVRNITRGISRLQST